MVNLYSRTFFFSSFRLGVMLQLASLNGLFVVTFDRFLYICYPLKYISWMTVPRCQTAIAMCWIAAFLLALTSLSTMSIVVLVPGYSAIGIIVILALHVAMFLTARKHARHVFQQFISLSMKPPVSKHRASKAVAMVFVSFLVCWMPVVLFTLLVPQEQEYFPKSCSTWYASLPSTRSSVPSYSIGGCPKSGRQWRTSYSLKWAERRSCAGNIWHRKSRKEKNRTATIRSARPVLHHLYWMPGKKSRKHSKSKW